MRYHKLKVWRKKAEVIKRRDGYMCRQCKRYGKRVDMDLVHHIYPAEDYPELFFNNDNLICLCNSCHEQMHDRATGEVTALGRKWQQRQRHKLFPQIEIPPPK